MCAHVLLIIITSWGKGDRVRGFWSILSLFVTNIINSIVQEHVC